jgi:VanZ family protein
LKSTGAKTGRESHTLLALRLLLRLIWAALLVLVVIGSLLPAASAPMRMIAALHVNDKVQHIVAYLSLAFLPALHERRRRLAYTAVGLVALGVLLEFGQLWSPGRSFEIGDMLADAAGVIAGASLGLWARPPAASRLAPDEG